MAFDRIGNLNEKCRKLLPKRWNLNRDVVEVPIDDLTEILDCLAEQDAFIHALWEEERKDGFEEMV